MTTPTNIGAGQTASAAPTEDAYSPIEDEYLAAAAEAHRAQDLFNSSMQAFQQSMQTLPNTEAKGETVDYLWSLKKELASDGLYSEQDAQLVKDLSDAALDADSAEEKAAVNDLAEWAARQAGQPGGLSPADNQAIQNEILNIFAADLAEISAAIEAGKPRA